MSNAVSYTNAGALTITIFLFNDGFGGTVTGITTQGGAVTLTALGAGNTLALDPGDPIDTTNAGGTPAGPTSPSAPIR